MMRLKRPRTAENASTADAVGLAGARILQRKPLSVALVELPGELFESEPEVGILVSGGHSPFQALPVTITSAGHELQVGSASAGAAVGVALEPLDPAQSELTDTRNNLVVRFAQDPVLTSCDEGVLLSGSNLLRIGGEFVQFATATPIAPATYALTHLLRGRFDSEAVVLHPNGSTVYILDPRAITKVKLPRDCIGGIVIARVYGPDGSTAETELTLAGLASQPWKPSHLEAADVQGGVQISWVRRCKEGGPWLDEVEAPLGASREAYTVAVSDQLGNRVEVQVTEPIILLSDEALTALGPRPWRVEVRQLGDFTASSPQTLTIN
jgi:hypothetical protein